MNHETHSNGNGDFDYLTPKLVLAAVEGAFGLSLQNHITAYNSYINRVYELHSDEGKIYMVKFYRPGRWSEEAILEEHKFIRDCVELEIQTVAPIPDPEGQTLPVMEVVDGSEQLREYSFALFPKRSGRNFDAESDDDWLRLGALVGRMHSAARVREAVHREYCLPSPIIEQCVHELKNSGAVHPDYRQEFFDLAEEVRLLIGPLFDGLQLHRVHGDCHRGNILERPGEGLLLIDFDDMMVGPAVQDLWLLLPERAEESAREFSLVVEGYERFQPFDYSQKKLIEPLRIMRMLFYLSWSARQRRDSSFKSLYPHWGGSAFWSKEIEDLREQLKYC